MATYNLGTTDLLTLLNSTQGAQGAGAVLESLAGSYGANFFVTGLNATTVAGPATGPGGASAPSTTMIAPGTQLVVVTTTGSTSVTGATYTPVTSPGQQTATSKITLDTSGSVIIDAGDQNITLFDTNTGTTPDTVIGGNGNQKLISTGGSNLLVAGAGKDTLFGGSGADTLQGAATSTLVAGSGANTLFSSSLASGSDTMYGGTGADSLVAVAGNNKLAAGAGPNTLVGGTGSDSLFGAAGGGTSIQMGSGATHVIETGISGVDTITGGTGTALSYVIMDGSGTFADSLTGGSNPLNISDLTGQNTIIGGAGADKVFLYQTATALSGSATVTSTIEANKANQTITAGAGGVKIYSSESFAYAATAQSGSQYTVTFSDTGQKLTINDTTGTSVKLYFSDHTSTL